MINNINDESIIEELLSEVNLNNVGTKKVRNFSLGMKQRLAIAMALINRPNLLILDEPINGLDPTGIIEIREILQNLNSKFGITIFISSHILSEMHQLATDYIFIHKGKIIKCLTAQELELECSNWLVVETDNILKSKTIIESLIGDNTIEIVNQSTIKIYNYNNSVEITRKLVENGVGVKQIFVKSENLEDYYSKIITR